ncbi:MAG: queuosine salvage family protein [Chloroflexota bacterium]|nr:queuosine salvage family protein [Chloroflexota bacterium]
MHPAKPLQAVRESAAFVARRARYVRVQEDAIAAFADRVAAGEMPRIEWDEEHHFRDGGPATAHYLLVLDALNFCFWPEPSWNYNRLALALKQSMLNEPERFDAARLASASEADVRTMLGGSDDIPLLGQRVALLREVGAVLSARWQGQAANLIRAADHSASDLVALATAEFPGFRDHAIYQGWPIYLYKRAQILAGDLWGSFDGQGLGRFDDIDQLTMFADYRVPQLLRGEGILEYNTRLASIVDLCRELPSGSDLEIEIRAASIHAVELLRDALAARDIQISALELDWILWNEGEAQQQELKPHHRTLTIYY